MNLSHLQTLAFGSVAALATTAAASVCVDPQMRRAEAEHVPPGHFIEVDGVRLHYVERGAGAGLPVLLLHGNGTMTEDFAASGLLDRLAESRRVIAFDRPGYGHSSRPADRTWTPEAQAALLAQALTELGVERAVVLGHSWGALVALALAFDHPDRVAGLVLASGYYFPTARPDALFYASGAIPVVGDLLRHTFAPLLGTLVAPRMIEAMFEPAPVPPGFSDTFPVALMLRPSQMKASAEEAALLVPAAAALGRRYRDLRLPVAVITGAEDRIVEAGEQSARLHAELPDSRLTLVPGLGHMVHHGAPALVAEAVEAIAATARPAHAETVQGRAIGRDA